MMMCHQTKFSCKRISRSKDVLESHILIISSFTVTMTLKTANQSFWKTIWLILTHHNTKFGTKKFCNLENIIWTFSDILKFCSDTTIQFLNNKSLWLMIMYYQTKFVSKRISRLEDVVESVKV